MRKNIKILILVAIFSLTAMPAWAYVMSSTNFEIQRDSINFMGGLGTSTSYDLESTGGEIGTGISTSTTYDLNAGYQQMDTTTYVTISVSQSSITLPGITSESGGTSNGTNTVTVRTNNSAGYTLQIKAASSPALISGANSFADYVKAGANPDFTWGAPAANSSFFGFTPEGNDLVQYYRDDGVTCNTGLLDTSSACWDSLSTGNKTIAQSSAADTGGRSTVTRFRAEAGTSSNKATGSYSASVTMTAYTN